MVYPYSRTHSPVALAADLALLRLDFLVATAVLGTAPDPLMPLAFFPVPGLLESARVIRWEL